MILTNYHTHTHFCDGQEAPEVMVQEAIAKGFNEDSFKAIKDIESVTRHDVKAVEYLIGNCLKELGYDYSVIPSGAFHDSLIMTSEFPTGMIFVPSVKGISHSREELTLEKDIENGCNVLLQTVLNVDNMK